MSKENRLVDTFGRKHQYLRISVTDRCNLRCTYCMPHDGIVWKKKNELLTFEEIIQLAEIFVDMGVDKIRLTGGEPMLRQNLIELVKRLAAIDGLNTLAMTTNATLLADNAQALHDAGLTALNISLDSFQKDKFNAITRRNDFDNVIAGLNAALALDFRALKLNVVVMAGTNDDEILDFADFAFNQRINVRFIEYMPFKDNQWDAKTVVTYQQMKELIEQKYQLTALSNEPSAVAKDFGLSRLDWASGEHLIRQSAGSVSFISSMSDSFCSSCNRLRLTSDGSIKSCLFYPAELSLRDAMRASSSRQEIEELIGRALYLKPEAHPPAEAIMVSDNRTMIEIGG
ncbi:MAG: GTP 3',8-cyclase MoaA [Candidatus Obscuribacterales bacterium]|nr:GTP 3',8-cyclase MoaA [Candidatus Obscuribacterales bacterium]